MSRKPSRHHSTSAPFFWKTITGEYGAVSSPATRRWPILATSEGRHQGQRGKGVHYVSASPADASRQRASPTATVVVPINATRTPGSHRPATMVSLPTAVLWPACRCARQAKCSGLSCWQTSTCKFISAMRCCCIPSPTMRPSASKTPVPFSRIQELSVIDDCTGVYNARHLFTVLTEEE